ncbi:MAG: hypothetical protein J2P38_04955 [Candidatus Dormibacteraeota bacterium]|nr:hypothetical protein [Candidatus Dormibacteraeota bacterium]
MGAGHLRVVAVMFLFLGALFGAAAVSGARGATAVRAATSPCQFQKAAQPVHVAFCDSFDKAAAANATRSGALNPTAWGVSRVIAGSGTNPGQGVIDRFPAAAKGACGGGTAQGDSDVYMCGGRLFDSVNDGGGQTVLAMYPRQPFDIAGRTGTVTFDVSDNSQGPHGAWPSFVYTDQPVPAPYDTASGIMTSARNSFGFSLDYVYNPAGEYLPGHTCATGGHTIGEVWETHNGRVVGDATVGGVNPAVATGFGRWQDTGCINSSSSPTALSHIEVRISTGKVVVWGSNPGTTGLVERGELDNASLPLTRGLVWIEDVHYNGNKFGSQGTNTFGWDNVGFDGPVLRRDLALEVPEHSQTMLGWTGGSTVTTLAGTAAQLKAASGALVELNWWAETETVPTISVNGHAAIATVWPFASQSISAGFGPTSVWKTIAVPVPLSELVAGANSIKVTNAPGGFANVDIILQGARGVPTCLDPSSCGG